MAVIMAFDIVGLIACVVVVLGDIGTHGTHGTLGDNGTLGDIGTLGTLGDIGAVISSSFTPQSRSFTSCLGYCIPELILKYRSL